MNPVTTFPIPCPSSSRSGLCRVWVIESATKDVSKVSTDPTSAMTSAG